MMVSGIEDNAIFVALGQHVRVRAAELVCSSFGWYAILNGQLFHPVTFGPGTRRTLLVQVEEAVKEPTIWRHP